MTTDCIFCKIIAKDIPSDIIYESELVLVFMDIMPLSDGHVLVLPKAHYETIFDMNEALSGEIMKVAWKVANVLKKTLEPDGLNLLQNNYKAANQVVPHFHLHLIPRNTGDNLNVGKWTPKKSDKENLKQITKQLKNQF